MLKYVGFYDTLSNIDENRNSVLAAKNKMDYIINAFNRCGYSVEVISPSWTTNKKFYTGKKIQINAQATLKLFPTLPWMGKLLKLFSVFFSFLLLFFYLIITVRKGEQIVVYHSRWLSLPIYLLKKFKPSTQLVLEVEEIYNDVHYSKFWGHIEYKLFDLADKYIFPTELLNEKLNKNDKPYLVIYGTYQVEKKINSEFPDQKIHAVYAGTLDPRKGCQIAATTAEFLPENYHIHIIGFGTKQDKALLLNKIEEISKKTDAIVTYDGLLSGEEYIKFLQKCHIGLSTQILNANYNETSFPSKILSYLSNGLRVVTVKIKSIEVSSISEKLFFYDGENPKSIAETIKSINVKDPYDSIGLIKMLDEEFVKNLKALLEKKNE
jgi:glycosyltransferase involved in cell wall biosynthesis